MERFFAKSPQRSARGSTSSLSEQSLSVGKRGIIATLSKRIKGYVVTKVVVSSVTGVAVWLVLTVLGVEMAMVFGLFAFLLNFVPSVGSIISTVLPLPIVLVASLPAAHPCLGAPPLGTQSTS